MYEGNEQIKQNKTFLIFFKFTLRNKQITSKTKILLVLNNNVIKSKYVVKYKNK